jgi:hypothetical protein
MLILLGFRLVCFTSSWIYAAMQLNIARAMRFMLLPALMVPSWEITDVIYQELLSPNKRLQVVVCCGTSLSRIHGLLDGGVWLAR